jgi:hypothetical protein
VHFAIILHGVAVALSGETFAADTLKSLSPPTAPLGQTQPNAWALELDANVKGQRHHQYVDATSDQPH